MATYYQYAYYIDGRKIGILRKNITTIDADNRDIISEYWATPDSDDANAIMFEYALKVSAPTSETDTIDIGEYLGMALVEYIKYRIAEDSGDIAKANYHYKKYTIKLHEEEDNRRGSPIIVRPAADAYALR
jgi:hypothetical protein